MSVKIDRVHSLATTGADLIVIPMHAKTMQKPLTLHPTLHETCLYQYPIAYSHFKDIESDGKLTMGDIVVSERIDTATVVWLIGRGDIRRKFDLHSIIKGLRQMRELDSQYPQYGFAQHNGYGTRKHLIALSEYGSIRGIHRHSFSPIKGV